MAVDLALLARRNDQRWKAARVTRPALFESRARAALRNRSRYVEIVQRLRSLGSSMPDEAWVFVAVVHERESSMDFNTHLGQGDPLTRNGVPVKTVHVPAGRGPFSGPDAFEQAAVDALWYCAPYAARVNRDWTIGGMLTYLERYNGLGYATRGLPSPYVWAGTDQYVRGKYIADGVFSATTVDTQPGCAGLLLDIDAMDDTIDFGRIEAPPIVPDLDRVDHLWDDEIQDAVWLQKAMNRLGGPPALKVDGIVGGATRSAVRAFQAAHGLVADGRAGPRTIPVIVRELRSLETAQETTT